MGGGGAVKKVLTAKNYGGDSAKKVVTASDEGCDSEEGGDSESNSIVYFRHTFGP